MGARKRGARCHAPPLWPCNKVLKPNFQSIISQANNDCSLLLIVAKLLLLDISCENICALSFVTALTACRFSIKKCAKLIVFYLKTAKIRWRPAARASPPDSRLCSPFWVHHCFARHPQKNSAYTSVANPRVHSG